MVIVKIMGGLGNQMFQYAFARSLVHMGKKVKLDISYYDTIPNEDTVRKYELDKFAYKFQIATSKEIARYNNVFIKIADIIGECSHLFTPSTIVEKEFCYKQELLEMDEKFFVGYWQSEKYFTSIRTELIKEITFQNRDISKKNRDVEEQIKRAECPVSIHIRAGDYLNQYNVRNFGNICTSEYYRDACDVILNKKGNAQFYLFTNDSKWVESNIDLHSYDVKVIDWNSEEDGWVDMHLMSLCKHNIIANSSFSWWAAWLNQNTKKLVVAPKKWQNNVNVGDIIPQDWIRL